MEERTKVDQAVWHVEPERAMDAAASRMSALDSADLAAATLKEFKKFTGHHISAPSAEQAGRPATEPGPTPAGS